MLFEFKGICQNCSAEVKILILNGAAIDGCPKCGEAPFLVRPVKGLVYIVANPNQNGVKVGLTTKTIEQRLKSLNSTGVPGNFIPIAIFPSDRPKFDEERVHAKLQRYNIAKEHFDLEPVDAVLAAYRALNKRKPVFFDSSLEEKFRLKVEEARIQMQIRLQGSAA